MYYFFKLTITAVDKGVLREKDETAFSGDGTKVLF
jgi:hypothetical protein